MALELVREDVGMVLAESEWARWWPTGLEKKRSRGGKKSKREGSVREKC